MIILGLRKLGIDFLGWQGYAVVGTGLGGSSNITCLGWDCMFASTWGFVKITGVG